MEFNKTNRFWIAHNKQEIGAIILTSLFCVDKTCFSRPGHKLCSIDISISVEMLHAKLKVVCEMT